jgi:hypothetical protein
MMPSTEVSMSKRKKEEKGRYVWAVLRNWKAFERCRDGWSILVDTDVVFRPHAYVGIEIEMNQAIVIGARPRWAALRTPLIDSQRVALAR